MFVSTLKTTSSQFMEKSVAIMNNSHFRYSANQEKSDCWGRVGGGGGGHERNFLSEKLFATSCSNQPAGGDSNAVALILKLLA